MNQENVSRIPVAYLILGYENNRKAIIDFHRNARTMINWVTDAAHLTTHSKIDWLWDELSDVIRRGIKCRKITDITGDNLPYCKKLMNMTVELRHLQGVRAVFGVSDIEFVAMIPSLSSREEVNMQLIHSDSESVVEHKQLIFDVLWNRATPAQSRISELEGNNVVGGGSIATLKAKTTIDTIYLCTDCRQTFIYAWEVEEHKKTTGHKNYRDFPLV